MGLQPTLVMPTAIYTLFTVHIIGRGTQSSGCWKQGETQQVPKSGGSLMQELAPWQWQRKAALAAPLPSQV